MWTLDRQQTHTRNALQTNSATCWNTACLPESQSHYRVTDIRFSHDQEADNFGRCRPESSCVGRLVGSAEQSATNQTVWLWRPRYGSCYPYQHFGTAVPSWMLQQQRYTLLCASILTWLRRFTNHLYLLTYMEVWRHGDVALGVPITSMGVPAARRPSGVYASECLRR